MNALRQCAVADGKVLIGNQVARRDQRVCLFAGKIFTLPLHFQMLFGQSLSGLLSIGRFLLCTRETASQSLEFLLSFAIMARVGYGVSFGVGQETLKTNINTNLFPGWNMLNLALGLDTEVAVVSICTADSAHPLDTLSGKGLDMLLLVANQTEATNAAAIGEGDMFAIIIQLPTSLLILDRAVVVLKLGIAFLSRLVLSAIGIEPINSKPCTISTGLTGLGIELGGKWECFCQDSATGLQVVFRDMIAIHFVFVDQHADCSRLSDMLQSYTIIELHVKRGWDTCPKNEPTSISPSDKRNNWKSAVRRKTYPWQRSSGGLLMPTWLGMTQHTPHAQAPQKGGPFIPRMNDGGFLGRSL